MENTVLAVTSRQMSIQREMDTLANNIANSSTDGFKSERMQFAEHLVDIGNNQTIAFVKDAGMIRDYSDGPLRATGNPLDIALRGNGFFLVEGPDEILFSRSGRLHLDPTGMLINADGMAILSQDGLPILTFPGDTSIIIDSNGMVSSESGELGVLSLVTFEDMSKIEKLGSGLYKSEDDFVPAEDVTVIQGSLEGSNVEPISEMTRMIALLRSYQGSQTLGNEEHDLRRKAISIIGSVNQNA